MPGGSALTYIAVLDNDIVITQGTFTYDINLATLAPNPIQVTISLTP